jgi:SWI/SNF-related matrix-associated actin-dependent regulator 1 of chromatin subfamily A
LELIEAFPYQVTGATWLAGKTQALLADEMGLGKSCQAILAADQVGAVNILVFAPANVRVNWQREWARFSPLDRPCAVLMTGKDAVPASGVVICSYDLATNPKILAQLKAVRWCVIVLDEAHYLKERSAQRTKAIYGHNSRSPGLAAHTDRIWRLTGTPAPNDFSELWTHLKSAGATTDAYWDFTYRFCTGFESDYGFRITGSKNLPELKALLAPLMLRRKKTDVLKDLPPISYSEVVVERSKVDVDLFFSEYIRGDRRAYNERLVSDDRTLRDALAKIQTIGARGQSVVQDRLRVLEGLATNLVALRRYIAVAKTPRVCEIIAEELASDPTMKIVIFAVHVDAIKSAQAALKRFGAVTLYGGTPPEKKQSHVDRFMTDPKCRVFIGNVIAAGTGITLTSACEVAFLEADWVPANNAQAAMRCHRIGQERPVRVRFFSCEGSVDEQVQTTLMKKTRELSKLF